MSSWVEKTETLIRILGYIVAVRAVGYANILQAIGAIRWGLYV